MKTCLAIYAAAAAAALLPSAVVGFQPAAVPSTIKAKTMRMMAASPNGESVSRGGFLST